MTTVPAKKFVDVNFNVLPSGGALINMNGMFITNSTLLPSGTVRAFSNADDVALLFGATSQEARMATTYFNGYSISTSKPGKLYFYSAALAATSATLVGGSLTMTLAQLQAITNGSFSITVDGITATTSGATSFAAATSFTDAAAIFQAAFTYPGAPNFTVTYNTSTNQFVFTSNSVGIGSTITEVTGLQADTFELTVATGAVLTQGANASADPGGVTMDAIAALTTNWATFTTTFEPTLALKKQFSDWVSARNAEYSYICWDTDTTSSTVDENIDNNIYNYVQAQALDNVFIVSRQSGSSAVLNTQAAFVSGIAASIDFNALNNRPTFAFKQQAGLTPGVTNQSLGDAIETNGGNYYVDTATKNTDFRFLFPGQVSGAFKWMDDLINAIYMKATMQNTLMTLLTNVPSVPYNQQGYQGLIATSLIGDINSFLNYGAIRTGVVLSGVQVAALTNRAGRDISQDLFNRGFVLDVLDPGAIVRAGRGSPIINLYYTSGGAVHKINLTATLVQ